MPQCAPWVDNPVGRYQVVTSGTRPTGSLRPTGQDIYETDTGKKLTWNGSAWTVAVNRAAGKVGTLQKTTDQATITTVVDITTPTWAIAWTPENGRRYLVSVEAFLISTVANDIATLILADASNNQLQSCNVALPSTSVPIRCHFEYEFVGAGVAVTTKVRCLRAAGTGSITFTAGAAYPAQFRIEDIGV